MFSELAQYLVPKRKAAEYTEPWDGDPAKLTDAQLKMLVAKLKEDVERERAMLAELKQLPAPGAMVVEVASTEA
jgi:hypothetical protein